MVVRDGSQIDARIINLTNSRIVYREQFVEIHNSHFICANDARISDLREWCTNFRFARMVHEFQIRANHTQCKAGIRMLDLSILRHAGKM